MAKSLMTSVQGAFAANAANALVSIDVFSLQVRAGATGCGGRGVMARKRRQRGCTWGLSVFRRSCCLAVLLSARSELPTPRDVSYKATANRIRPAPIHALSPSANV